MTEVLRLPGERLPGPGARSGSSVTGATDGERTTVYVEEHGPRSGTPILFLHGSMVAGWMWTEQVQGLPDHRALVPDLPGTGGSGDLPWRGFADTADLVADLIAEHVSSGSAHVVGLSLGGVVGLHLAAQRPEVVASLLVSGVPSGRVPAPLRAANALLLRLYPHEWGAALLGRILGLPDDESMVAFRATARRTDPAALRAIAAEAAHDALPRGLASAAPRTLAVVGERDTAPARRTVGLLARTMPDARGYVVPGVGHQWNAEAPGLFTDMVRAWVDDAAVDPRLRPAVGA